MNADRRSVMYIYNIHCKPVNLKKKFHLLWIKVIIWRGMRLAHDVYKVNIDNGLQQGLLQHSVYPC